MTPKISDPEDARIKGRQGGLSKSPAKVEASRINGRKGGRPKKNKRKQHNRRRTDRGYNHSNYAGLKEEQLSLDSIITPDTENF